MEAELAAVFTGKDMTGMTFGLWTVIRFHRKDASHNVWWWCRCECGTEKPVLGAALRSGASASCGCQQYTKRSTLGGLSKTPEYNVWIQMNDRCTNPKTPCFHRYGGRGIAVCDRWRDSFLAFYEDMGPRPSPDHSIDRIDNDGPYSPENCRWAEPDQQYGNTSANRLIEYKGETKHLNAWARQFRLNRELIRDRLDRGWSVADALETPPRAEIESVTYNGKTQKLTEWARELGVDYSAMRRRYHKGLPIERVLHPKQAARRR